MRKSPLIQVEEISGDQLPDLETVQRVALPLLADNLRRLYTSQTFQAAKYTISNKDMISEP